MKRILTTACLWIFSFQIVFAQTTAPPKPRPKTAQQDKLEKQLRDTDLQFSKETGERRLEGWMDFFADDAAVIRDGKVITGKQSLRELFTPVFANKDFSLSWTPTKVELSKDGTLGYTYGDYEAKNGQATSRGMYVTVWRLIGGKWKVVLDLGSQPREQPKPANGS